MQNIVWKIGFIVVILAACVWWIVPPKEKIRLGRDLRGGVSMIYSVRIDDVQNAREIINQTISVLKDRVNPQGLLDISMQALGLDRIEIIMPLPNEEVMALRRAYEGGLEQLLDDAQIRPDELDVAVRHGGAVERFGGEGERGMAIADLQTAWDTWQSDREALEAGRDSGADETEIGALEQAVADADLAFGEQREAVLRMSLDRSRLVRTLNLPDKRKPLRDETGKPLIDPETDKPLTMDSQRDVALRNLQAEFSHLSDALDALATAFDEYQNKRTGFDDPQDLIRLLRGAGVLEFRIAVNSTKLEGVNPADLRQELAERGPERTGSRVAKWYRINDLKQWYDGEAELAQLEADPRTFFAGLTLVAEEHEGEYYLLLYTSDAKSMTHKEGREWNIVQASRSADRLGRPAVQFRMDIPGGGMMSRLTGPHVGEAMAIVLDGQVFSAPTLQGQIGITGIITGNFSESEINYLIRVLAAGSLRARLSPEPIAINTLGPSIGEDNLTRGLDACLIAIIAVAAFMMLYYFFAGMVANFALLANGVIIFGIMALIDGTFTLPGLAGIVLTIGMAVDANVLIYERIREELFADESDLRGAIRRGYGKALSTIIDANVTNLIVCIVLFYTATTEVKGFALTLTIGICATLFTTLFVTRVIYTLYTDLAGFRRLPMLPTVFPAIHRALEPQINWMGLRKIFWPLSLVAVVGSVALVSSRGVDMFDTEFRGGVSVTMRTALVDPESGPKGERDWLRHTGEEGVETRVQLIGRAVSDPTPLETRQKVLRLLQSLVEDPDSPIHQLTAGDLPNQLPRVVQADDRVASLVQILAEMRNASVLTVGDTRVDEAGIIATNFQIKVASPKGLDDQATITDVVVSAVVNEFGDQLDVTQPLDFEGAGSTNHAQYTFFIEKRTLGENINRPQYKDRVNDYLGGVAIVIDDLEPPATTDDIAKRIDRMRAQPDFAEVGALGREVKVFGLEVADPADLDKGYQSVAVVVYDRDLRDVDLDVWDDLLASQEWRLVSAALQRRSSLERVSSFSSAVAQTLRANAIVAVGLALLGILVYIWLRFGSLRYSVAAITALVHDVTLSLGLLALTGYIGGTAAGSVLLIEEFQIDLGVVAALLTIIGYSLNDTIVILDRIRENRGKLPIPTGEIVNRSINQTVSRTVLTSTTTLLAVAIMYAEGGSGIRPFAFCLLAGVAVGTYSSVAIAAPLVIKWGGGGPGSEDKEAFWKKENAPEGA